MSRQKEKAVLPELRFPEFCDAGPWEVKWLGKLVKTVTPPTKLQTSEYLPSGQFPIIDQSPGDICGWTNDETALVRGDFPLVVFGDHTCTVKLVRRPFAQGADGIKILVPTPEIEARFLFLALQADPIEQKGYKRHFSTLKEKLIPFPRKDTGEQQKIADCLSSLDDLIRAEEGQLAALKDHKKGLMQRLFPAEGETTPRLRFPEFRDAGPWEMKRLGDVFKFSSGNTPPKSNAKFWSGSLPWVSASSMYDTRIAQADHYISEEAVKKGAAIAPEGAILLLVRGSMLFKRIPIGIATKRVSFNQDVKALIPLETDANVLFFLHYLIALERFLLTKVLPTGIGAGKLEASDLQDLNVSAPSPPEQQKIANCLSSLDDLIRADGEKIEALKQHKKGLMQQLFPQEVI